jgi:hypothetical protein
VDTTTSTNTTDHSGSSGNGGTTTTTTAGGAPNTDTSQKTVKDSSRSAVPVTTAVQKTVKDDSSRPAIPGASVAAVRESTGSPRPKGSVSFDYAAAPASAPAANTNNGEQSRVIVELPAKQGRMTARVFLNMPDRDRVLEEFGHSPPTKSVVSKEATNTSSLRNNPVSSDTVWKPEELPVIEIAMPATKSAIHATTDRITTLIPAKRQAKSSVEQPATTTTTAATTLTATKRPAKSLVEQQPTTTGPSAASTTSTAPKRPSESLSEQSTKTGPSMASTTSTAAKRPPEKSSNQPTKTGTSTASITSTGTKRPAKSAVEQPTTKSAPTAATKPNPDRKVKRKVARPLSEQEILRSFPTADASSVLMLHGRKIDMDATPGLDNASTSPLLPLYPILRAWIQDDPFRTIPRPEASVDIWYTSTQTTATTGGGAGATRRDRGVLSGITTTPKTSIRTGSTDATTSVPPPLDEAAKTNAKLSSMAVNQSEKSVDDLRKEMIERGKARRRQQSKVVQQGYKVGMERLRRRGIHF